MTETPVVVQMIGVTFGYDGGPVLEDATFAVRQGEFLAVVGPNAGGKTTLLKVILGLLKPQRGTVRVFGRPPEEARPRIGYVPQSERADPRFPVSVLDVVLMGRLGRTRRLGRYARADRDAAGQALREVGLEGLERRPFASLSGGQRQRALIARALAGGPDLLLLDEPTASLDPRIEREFADLLRRLNERLTVLIVSHNLSFVWELSRHVLCVNRRVALHPTSVVDSAAVWELFGGPMRLVRHEHACPPGEHDHGPIEETYG